MIILIVTSVLICCFSGVYASAQTFFNHTSFLEEHIDWVQGEQGNADHYPQNLYGSCAYVAMSVLLSFYDTYWRDEFVPDGYETMGFIDDVTGNIWYGPHFNIEYTEWAKHWINYVQENEIDEEAPETEAIKNTVYDQFVTDNKGKYFHMFLISLGKEKGYHNDEAGYGLYQHEIIGLLNDYLQTISHLSSSQVEVHVLENDMSTSREDLFNKIKEKVQQGFPVLYSGVKPDSPDSISNSSDKSEGSRHMLLAYKLTSDGNDIVLASGWNRTEAQTFNTTEFQYNPYIIWLEIKDGFHHECSVSYKYSSTSDKEYCACKIFSEHPNHEHEYSVTAYSDNMHWKKCLCGDSQQREYHQLEFLYNFANQHVYGCEAKECNYELMVDHLPIYTSVSSSLHSVKCDNCNYTELEAHTFRPSENPRYYRCIYCGYTRDEFGGGGNIIMGKKEEDEIE